MPSKFRGAAALFIIASLTACGSADDSPEAREKQIQDYARKHGVELEAQVSRDGSDDVTIRQQIAGGGTSMAGNNLALPADFPDDVPLYPGLRILVLNKVPMGQTLQGQTGDAIGDVEAYFRATLPRHGWSDQSDPPQHGVPMSSLRFVKDGRAVGLNLIRTGDETNLTLMVGPAG